MAPVDEAPLSAAGSYRAGTLRGREGFFRVGQDTNGNWCLIDPAGAAFFGRAVHGVRARPPAGGANSVDPAVLLRRLGFNAVGVGGDGAGRDDGLPYFALLDFCRAGPQIVAPGARLPDVFAADWPQIAAQHALAVCGPLAGARELMGWVTDDSLGWAQRTQVNRPSLLQICLSLEPGFGSYHAAWEFVLALHGGRLEALARAWGVPLANKEVLREFTRSEKGIATRGYWRDEARWTREFARRYFSTTANAIRHADPNHLVLGCRFGANIGPPIRSECIYPAVDLALVDWKELPAVEAVSTPLLADNVCWADPDFLTPHRPLARGPRQLTVVERMLRHGRLALERTARHPAVVGYAWSQWYDEPGEQPPFAHGLVHLNGAEAREHTELLAQFNARADSLRRLPPPAKLP